MLDWKLCCGEKNWPRLWRGTHADQIWYLGLGLPNEAPIAAFLFIPVSHKPSQLSFCCFLVLFYQRFHCLRVWSCQTVRPPLQTRVVQKRHQAWIKIYGVFFYWVSAVKSQSSNVYGYKNNPTISADMTNVTSFPQGDVVIHAHLYQPGIKFVLIAQRAAGCKMIRHSFYLLMFWPELAWSALHQLVWEAGALVLTFYSWCS